MSEEYNMGAITEFVGKMIEGILLLVIVICCGVLSLYTYHTYVVNNPNQDNLYLFEKIANHVASDYTYEEDIFDCSEYSHELYDRLKCAGYDKIDVVRGCENINQTECHAWVVLTLGKEEIHIESTRGMILPKAYYMKNYPYHRYVTHSTYQNALFMEAGENA
jgi:hypothetical protein